MPLQISDAQIETLFAENPENEDLAIYEGAEVRVHSAHQLHPIDEFLGSGIDNSILLNVAQMGFKRPTNVQKYAIPYVLDGHDIIVTAQTGSGKTAAFMLPVLTGLARSPRPPNPSVVALVPTRELALQIEKETRRFCGRSGIKPICIYGGAPIGSQLQQLSYGCDILIATPGRLIDMLTRDAVYLYDVRYLVLDEADRMLDMGFEPQISQVINEFDMPGPDDRQTLLFSATFPREVQELARAFMRDDGIRIEVGMQDAPTLIEQRFVYVPEGRKFSTLLDVIRDLDGQTLVFAERKVAVDRIEEYLYDENYAVVAIHGDRPMQNRQAALKGFTNGRAHIMVATDVAARGLDIPNVAHVINMDLPTDVDTYTHRIGRTGRAGKRGVATSFWNEDNQQFLAAFVRHLRQERLPIPAGLEKFDPDRRQYAPQRGGGGFRRYTGPR
jgi:ATP-dependent RNA helicase DDX3X